MDRNWNGFGVARRAIVTAAGTLALVGLVTLSAHARGPGWGN